MYRGEETNVQYYIDVGDQCTLFLIKKPMYTIIDL